MQNWIKQNKVPLIFIIIFLIASLFIGIRAGLGYLNAERQAFVDKLVPGAIEGWENYKILPSLTISQGILESGWGKSHIENNLFGMKPGGSWTGKVAYRNTKEFYDGKWVTISAGFRSYPNFSASIADHAKLLGTLSRYRAVLGKTEYKVAAMEVWKGGYATDPNYPSKLVSIIETYGLAKYDTQAIEGVAEKERLAEEERLAKLIKFKYAKDVPDDKWFTEAINRLIEQGVILGNGEKDNLQIRPTEAITRAELFILIDRILNEEAKE